MIVATGLVYDVAFYLAKSSGGLPIGYLFTHLEFVHVKNLLNPRLWTSPLPHGKLLPSDPTSTSKLYMFAILATFLTIVTNLMGPATAVLVLPSLQWVETDHIPTQVFGAFAASSPPKGEIVLPGCNDTHFSARNYTCTSAVYGPSLDNWFAQLLSTAAQAKQNYGVNLLGTTQEGAVETTINVTAGDLVWVPSRQALRDLSWDVIELGLYITGSLESNNTATHKQPAFNNSLETVLQRQAPSLGMAGGCFVGNLTIKDLEGDRQIRCLYRPEIGYSRCYRAGAGWAKTNAVARFYLGDADEEEDGSYVQVYSSDKATFFNDTAQFGSSIEDCMQESATDCNWDQLFDAELDTETKNFTINVLVSEYKSPLNDSSRFCCEATVYTAFPTYTVNTAHSNPLMLVNMNQLPVQTDENFNITPIAVHPDWVLAAWSVANNGTVNGSREVGKGLARLIPSFYDEETRINDNDTNFDAEELVTLYMYSMAQTLSLIDYSYTDDATSLAAASQARDRGKRVFYKWATLRVWAYGLGGRTSRLGATIALLGCFCVVMRVILAVSLKIRHEHSTVELFVAALEHRPTGEFDDLDDEATMAKVRYIMQDGEKGPKFVSERVFNSGSLKSGHIA